VTLTPAGLGVELPKIPFRRDVKFPHGVVERIPTCNATPLRRIVAPNENMFSFRGTGTYIVGEGEVAIVDPGPLIDSHVDAILNALKGEAVTHILITHTHSDHSPAAAPIRLATGAKTYGFGPHGSLRHDGVAVEEGGDMDFRPDVTLRDGAAIAGRDWTFEAIHTPGHTSNHLCFSLREENILFPGDHVMGWSTTVVAPPDGDMTAYMTSLEKLTQRTEERYYPTHGEAIENPQSFVRLLIEHRKARDGQILECLRRGVKLIPEMVAVIYRDVDRKLHAAAALSVLAHLQAMVRDGRALSDGPVAIRSKFSAL
jgi:glyoxylase-like metal-dependent hydrolase (beta-lactamase superfamily II)